MRNPILPPIILLLLAAALYLLPDGSFYKWQLYVRGSFARLLRPEEPRPDAGEGLFSDRRDLLNILLQRDAEIADLRRRLDELGVSRDTVENVRIVPAKVVRLGPDNRLDTFTIDAGTRQGVEAGQAVVVGQALAGVVVRSEAEASLVLSLASPGCYISARLGEPEGSVGRPRLLCGVRGIGGGAVSAILFSPESAAKEGWVATTSGLEKSIPENLLLGRLAGRFVEGEESGTVEAELRPEIDLTSLDFVAVVARK